MTSLVFHRTRIPFRRQSGQALILGLFVMLAGSASLYFLFNTGQLTQEKVKLVNTADAVAYSAGLLEARAMNFDAYGNRALLANEVAIAQMVSVSSWSKYIGTLATNLPTEYPNCQEPGPAYPYYGKTMLVTFALCYASLYGGAEVAQAMEYVPYAAQAVAMASEVSKGAIKTAQSALHMGSNAALLAARADVMNRVADANYQSLGAVQVDLVPLDDNLSGFMQRFRKNGSGGDERARLGELARTAAYRDEFVRDRSWAQDDVALVPTCYDPLPKPDRSKRRGGTELLGYDEWKAMDTLSHHRRQPRGWRRQCREREAPLGYGAQSAYAEQQSGGRFGGSRRTNPSASDEAESEDDPWSYSGIPDFYDLSEDMLNESDPKLRLAIRLTRRKADTRTTETAAPVKAGGRLAIFDARLATDRASGEQAIAALSSAEVFFARPEPRGDGRKELGSLFNPFWHVRLTAANGQVRASAAALQDSTFLP